MKDRGYNERERKRGDLTGEEGPTTSDRYFLALSFILKLQLFFFLLLFYSL